MTDAEKLQSTLEIVNAHLSRVESLLYVEFLAVLGLFFVAIFSTSLFALLLKKRFTND
jgi:hypothetical protein